MALNRKAKRKMEKAGVIASFDATTMFRLKFDIGVPGGLLRSDFPAKFSGVIEAQTEGDLLRGALVKLLDAFGYTQHDRAVSGVLGDALGPLPKRVRGNIAYALIEGLGLSVGLETEQVCACGAIFRSEFDGTEQPRDTTVHAVTCEEPTFHDEEVISILNPRYYEPLTNKAIDPETGEVTTPLVVKENEDDGADSGTDAAEDAGSPEAASE